MTPSVVEHVTAAAKDAVEPVARAPVILTVDVQDRGAPAKIAGVVVSTEKYVTLLAAFLTARAAVELDRMIVCARKDGHGAPVLPKTVPPELMRFRAPVLTKFIFPPPQMIATALAPLFQTNFCDTPALAPVLV